MAHEHSHVPRNGAEALRGSGRRLTRQRRLVWDALVERPDAHLSADDIVARVHQEMPGLDPSTVYRTLDLLIAEGLLLRTDLGADRAFYEPAHEHAHHHLVCEQCGNVEHIHDDALGNLRQQMEATAGFALGTGEITFSGRCANCRADGARESR